MNSICDERTMLIREATSNDAAAIWSLIGPIIRAGETYTLPRDMSEADALSCWMGTDRQTCIAVADNRIVGTYSLRANQAGGGDHVANCGYITDSAFAGRGVARVMAKHSLALARSHGFLARQFNFVKHQRVRGSPVAMPWPRNRGPASACLPPSLSRLRGRFCHVPRAVRERFGRLLLID